MSTPLPSSDPNDLPNLARCFSCYVPPGMQIAVRNYITANITQNATNPVCTAPSAPTGVSASNARVADPNTQMNVRWLQPANPGSFITGYVIKWGTVSGVYTNSMNVPLTPKNFTVTGLSPGTTYFFVVQAFAFAGCVSANSNEASNSTSGSSLLTNLVHYWDLESVVAFNVTDRVAGTILTETTAGQDASLVVGKIGNCIQYDITNSNNGLANTTAPSDVVGGAAISQTYAMWFWIDSAQPFGVPHNMFGVWSANVALQYVRMDHTAANTVVLFIKDGANVEQSVTANGITLDAWHYFVGGYDNANSVIWMQIDNGARITAPMVGMNTNITFDLRYFNYLTGGRAVSGRIDEIGIWHARALSLSDVATLYNGGNGLPFGSF